MIFSPHFLSVVASSQFLTNIKNGQIIIDNSEFTQWNACFAKGLYSGALRRVGARSRAPLAFGGAVHAGLDAFFNGSDKWLDRALADAAVTELDSLGDPKRNTDKLADLLSSYTLEYSRHRDMQFDILKIEDKPAVEKSFVAPLGSIQISPELAAQLGCPTTIEILWSGKIDLLTKYEGAITPVDHKTTSVMGEKFVDDKVRSSQMLGYTFAARYFVEHIFGGLPVFGVRINALAMRSAGFEFKQFDIPYPDWKVKEWQGETLGYVKQLLHQLGIFLSTNEVFPTREHCVTKYGKCAYFDCCDSVPAMRDRMIFDDSYFFVSDWSPLNE